MHDLEVECIFPKNPKEFNKFIRGIELHETKVINFISIRNKLLKSDPYGKEPNDSIVGLAISNDISRCLRSEKKQINKIIYLLRNLEYETLLNFKNMISEKTDSEFELNLTMLYSNRAISEDLLNLFNTVNYIKHDQA